MGVSRTIEQVDSGERVAITLDASDTPSVLGEFRGRGLSRLGWSNQSYGWAYVTKELAADIVIH